MCLSNDLLSFTDPSMPSRMLSLFISLWITWLECRKSSAWRHCRARDSEREEFKNISATRPLIRDVWANTHLDWFFFCLLAGWGENIPAQESACVHLSVRVRKQRGRLRWCRDLASYLSADCSNLALIHAGLGHYICQRAASQVLHHHPELVSYQVTTEKQEEERGRLQCDVQFMSGWGWRLHKSIISRLAEPVSLAWHWEAVYGSEVLHWCSINYMTESVFKRFTGSSGSWKLRGADAKTTIATERLSVLLYTFKQ